ncbi:hypothetical protein FisN_3Lh007 [Fistulifera solaris]|uniref:SEA domain-containing protein n=1 Tax=Fistulifera solaris TaxID=1519565 RepID=A0A1Z5JYW4_FISSO|nr:hypothetical protein FisN_3Lh007 [Fistulifera solaris]|eukprot:GAX19072.1 hypothetical protein FisN_3Lh007 [Fistulifera solaris]
MRLKLINYTAILFAALLGSATSSLLRGDYAIRSPRILENKHGSSATVDDAGRKNNRSHAKGSKKSSKENSRVDRADASIAVGESGPKETQIVHSHHPKALEQQAAAKPAQTVQSHHSKRESSDVKRASKKTTKQVVQSHHPNGAGLQEESHVKEPKRSNNGRKSSKKRSENDETAAVENQSVLSRAYDTQGLSPNDEEDGITNVVGRPIEILVFEYSTRSNKLPSEVETLYLVHLTEQFLDNMYARTFDGVEAIQFEGLEVQRYKLISSRMIQFEITILFQAKNDASAPSIAEVKSVILEGMKHEGAFYAEYLASLEQMPFDVFSTTVSCHVVTDADELDNLMNFQVGRVDDNKPPVILICAVLMASLSVCVCAVAWFRCVLKPKNKSATEYATSCNSEGAESFKKATFDDLVSERGYFVDEADLERVEASNLVEVKLTDDYESVEESEWTDESSTSSHGSNGDFTEESQDSAISALRKWIPSEREFCQAASCGREREQPPNQSSKSSIPSPCIEKCSQEASELIEPLWSSTILCQAQNRDREEDTVCRQRFTTKQAARDEMTTNDQNKNFMKINPTTDSKFVPLWMIKRQEIMRRREEQSEPQHLLLNALERSGFEADGPLSASKKAANDTSKACGALHSQESIAVVLKSGPKEQYISQNPIRIDKPAPVSSPPLSVLNTSLMNETTDQSSHFGGELGSEPLTCTAPTLLSECKPAGPSIDKKCSQLDELPTTMKKQTKAALHQNAMKDKNVSRMPLWMSKRQEILHPNEQVSDDQALNFEMQHPTANPSSLQSPLIEKVTEPVNRIFSELYSGEPSASWDEQTNASVEEISNAIKTSSTATDDEIPLWLKKRPDVVHKEESVQESDDFNNASYTSLNGAPAWMTRFKQLEKE